MTFKDPRKILRIIAEKKREMETEAKYYDPNYFWKGKDNFISITSDAGSH